MSVLARLTSWARADHGMTLPTEYARAARLLWSDEVLEISDAEFAEIGRILGIDDSTPQTHNTVGTEYHNTVTPQPKVQVN